MGKKSPKQTVASAQAILEQLESFGGEFDRMHWADVEIRKAVDRYPDKRNILYHCFSPDLMRATHELMGEELVFRAHCRELLERVATGRSTKPGTAVEVALACMENSLKAPLSTAAAGLYMRMWKQAEFGFSQQFEGVADDLQYYEAIAGSEIDELERVSRVKLAVADRVLHDIECDGIHWGERVDCEFADKPVKAAA
ncbi:hypothetical protein NONI108955_20935 [Nocardia ninae]|uniref:Uncharacterized protein n=1 Tax=Nocardia ninae NBRC 108245 TaxID=1210091 RepID=A0A511MA01_9NOCA|nr:hypothetical protein [Nocardia ninae]GEM37419.1 hypothetical protein NN4_19380 [Nocardia ninae NBRC 108245]